MSPENRIAKALEFLDHAHTLITDLSYCVGGKTHETEREYLSAYNQYTFMAEELEAILKAD